VHRLAGNKERIVGTKIFKELLCFSDSVELDMLFLALMSFFNFRNNFLPLQLVGSSRPKFKNGLIYF